MEDWAFCLVQPSIHPFIHTSIHPSIHSFIKTFLGYSLPDTRGQMHQARHIRFFFVKADHKQNALIQCIKCSDKAYREQQTHEDLSSLWNIQHIGEETLGIMKKKTGHFSPPLISQTWIKKPFSHLPQSLETLLLHFSFQHAILFMHLSWAGSEIRLASQCWACHGLCHNYSTQQ